MPNEINAMQEQLTNEYNLGITTSERKETESDAMETRGLEFDDLKPCGDYFQTAKASSTGQSW